MFKFNEVIPLIRLLVLAFHLLVPNVLWADADSLVGVWQVIDAKNSGVVTLMEVYFEGESLSAKILRVQDKKGGILRPICDSCPGELAGKPVTGMRFMWGLKREGAKWVDGNVINLQPGLGQGVVARCELERVGTRAKVFGSWWLFSDTSYWERHDGAE